MSGSLKTITHIITGVEVIVRIINQLGNRAIEASLYDITLDERRIFAECSTKSYLLGEYKTEDRAEEVFNWIFKDCNRFGTIKMPED